MAKSTLPTQVSDFTVLPLRIPSTPSFPKERTTHYLYLRPNAPRVPTADTPRELFLVNVPFDASGASLKALFAEHVGGVRVEDVEFEGAGGARSAPAGIRAPASASSASEGMRGKKRKRGAADVSDGEEGRAGEDVGLLPETWPGPLLHPTGSTAVLRFVDRASADLALKTARRRAAQKPNPDVVWCPGRNAAPLLGSARYAAHHALRFPDPSALQSSVDAFMSAFSAQEVQRAQLLQKQRSEPDEDGFVTVTRGGRAGPAREEEVRAKEEELKRRERDRVKGDFYRFQTRERRREEAGRLVKGFEEDRRRVEEVRRRRGRLRPE